MPIFTIRNHWTPAYPVTVLLRRERFAAGFAARGFFFMHA